MCGYLRNHALLYDKTTKLWHLSPSYDLNPTPYPYKKQRHALNFGIKVNETNLFKQNFEHKDIENTKIYCRIVESTYYKQKAKS